MSTARVLPLHLQPFCAHKLNKSIANKIHLIKIYTLNTKQTMCDSSAVLDLNTLGIMHFRNGRKQEAMCNFESSLTQLMIHVQSSKRFRGLDAHGQGDILQPQKKRRRNDGTSDAASRPEVTTAPTKTKQAFAMTIPLKDAEYCGKASSLFNQVLVLPQHEEITRENCDVIYAALLYNMALVLHHHGLEFSCDKSLLRALETYELAHQVLLQDLHSPGATIRKEATMEEGKVTKKCIQHWLLYAVFNNMASIYAGAHTPTMANYCLERLRCVLTYTDSSLLKQQDLLFYVVNLDVLGCPHISAGAA